MSNHRCACCGRTNDHRLLSKFDDYTRGPFHKDPMGKYDWDEICDDCLSVTAEFYEPFTNEEEDEYSLYTD